GLVPTGRVVVCNGKMDEEQLARVMVEFTQGSHDVLVCTTIIESGLDIPNVNTMLVERADRFGLSQLYQLRGRVGRAGKRAYVYFLYDPARSLTEAADKRLDVMSGLHELGQGFKIALRDLDIRDERLRLDAYRQLAAAEGEAELDGVLRSLRDRYGPPPAQLDNLVYSLRVKLHGQRLGLRAVVADGRDIAIRVDPDRLLDVDE